MSKSREKHSDEATTTAKPAPSKKPSTHEDEGFVANNELITPEILSERVQRLLATELTSPDSADDDVVVDWGDGLSSAPSSPPALHPETKTPSAGLLPYFHEDGSS